MAAESLAESDEGLLADAAESRFDGRTAVVEVADLFLEGREADRDEDEALRFLASAMVDGGGVMVPKHKVLPKRARKEERGVPMERASGSIMRA